MLTRSAGRIDHVAARRVTPLAAPMLLETGKVPIKGGGAEDAILADEASLMAEVRSDA